MTATLQSATSAAAAHARTRMLHPIIMMLAIIVAAVAASVPIGPRIGMLRRQRCNCCRAIAP